jgi:hypothetical protein
MNVGGVGGIRRQLPKMLGFLRFPDPFLVRVYPNRVFPVTRKTRPPSNLWASVGPMWRFRFRLLGKARHHRVRSRLASVGVGTATRGLMRSRWTATPPSKVGYRRATRKYMLTSRFTAYDPSPTSGRAPLKNGWVEHGRQSQRARSCAFPAALRCLLDRVVQPRSAANS